MSFSKLQESFEQLFTAGKAGDSQSQLDCFGIGILICLILLIILYFGILKSILFSVSSNVKMLKSCESVIFMFEYYSNLFNLYLEIAA